MDHLKAKQRNVNPEEHTNILLRFFFIYTRHILRKGFQKEITEDDLYEVRPNFKTKKLGDLLEREWNLRREKNKHSVLVLLWKCFGKEYFLILTSLVIPMTLTFFQPKFVKKFILCFTSNRDNLNSDGYFYGSLLVLVAFVRVLHAENFGLYIRKLNIKIQAGLTSLIYRRALEMKNVDKTSVGKIVNLITRDVNDFNILQISMAFKETLSCLIICTVLYLETGLVSLSLVAIFLTILCVDYYFAALVKKIKLKSLKKTDERYQITKEVLNAFKLIKCYLWQDAYKEKVCKIRNKEVGYISKIYFLLFTKFTLAESVADASWYVIVVILIWSGGQSNAGTLFLILNSMNQLTSSFRYVLPAAMHAVAKLITVSRRIEIFLKSTNELHIKKNDKIRLPKIKLSKVKINVENSDFLHFSNFETDSGVTALTGPIGSGKSLLLKTIAKEHEEVDGSLKVSGSMSYASQEPWLFPSTIKQNILFGSDYDAKRYLMVLEVCGLRQDLQQLEEGDATIVADGGVNLSKGQQTRINLARAVYKDCDIYLLDDCLSSLDVLMADFIFEECIKKFLKGKIVLMVTQNKRHISRADNVIILINGIAELKDIPTHISRSEIVESGAHSIGKTECKIERFVAEDNFDDIDARSLMETAENEKRLYVEKKTVGKVQFDVYKKYIDSSGGIIKLSFVLIFFIIIQILKRIINKLESNWINNEQIIFSNSTNRILYTRALENRSQMFYVLPILFAIVAIIMLLKVKVFWCLAGNASINLHKLLFERVMNASMEFFDSRFIGTILNRFSEDLFYIDEIVPNFLISVIRFVVEIVGIVLLIGTVSPLFIMLCLVNTTILIYVRFFYLKTGRALKRLEFTSRSPLIGHINATMEGLSVIRVSKMQKILREELDRHQDLYTSASYISMCCEKAFLFVVDLFSVFIIFAVINYFLMWHNDTSVGNIGLVLSHIFRFAMQELMLFLQWTKLENEMTTVERVLEFTKERQESKDGFVVEKWPSDGVVRCEDLCFSYNNQTSVLKNLNFVIEAKEKVAIVGRTASGKTSLISTLLRLYKVEGKIYIDDVDISTLPLDFYRSQISIVPQDPILFTGTLRENIDPTNKYKDDEIWKSLKTVNLTIFESLEDKISTTDSNLSVGQKQLICLSRALIRKNKIVILDEITANVDSAAQDLIHEVLFKQFKDSTVIEITHKLDHIFKYDKVIVMEEGRLVGTGSPSSLLQNQNSTFCKMLQKINISE